MRLNLLPAVMIITIHRMSALFFRFEFVASPALTPALSPRRGGIVRRGLSHRNASVVRKFSPANHQLAATGHSTSELHERVHLPFPLPVGEGQGEGERHADFKRTSNVEQRTFNAQRTRRVSVGSWRLNVGCWTLPPCSTPRLHSHRDWTIVAHGSAGRHRGRRMGRVVSPDAARTLARQRRVVGALPFHRRFA